MEIRLNGKRALVTGASSGIGAAIAVALGQAGADVAVNYHSHPEAAQAVAKQIEGSGVKTICVQADIANADDVARMFQEVEQGLGPVDILINNAGVDGPRAPAWEADLAAWQDVVRINLFGPFFCAHYALRGMVQRRSGVVINVSSVHEVIPWAGYSDYAASKAGLGMLTKTLAQEAASFGVRVLAVAPGAIQTPINQSVWGNPAGLADLLTKIPYGRLGKPEEIGAMVVVLASDVASYLTGTTVYLDGGMTLYPSFQHGG